jgi:hypothetical protein
MDCYDYCNLLVEEVIFQLAESHLQRLSLRLVGVDILTPVMP